MAGISPQRLDQVRAEQVAGFYHSATPGTIGGLIAAVILAGMLVYVNAIPWQTAIIFWSFLSASTAFRIALIHAYRKTKPPKEEWRRWAFWALVSALIGGLCWGLGSLTLLDPSRPELQLMVFLTCAALAAGAMTAFGTYLPAYYINLTSIILPTALWSALQHDALHWTYTSLAVLWVVVIGLLARSFSRLLVESLRLQFVNLDLANDLLRQKEIAEAANISKSRFLASASHDLRQPVHALGMFVGALRDRALDRDSGKLVEQIEKSVGALDSLFSAILDISRLDAGIIEAQPRPFAIQPMLERICKDERTAAERKGVALRLVPCSAHVNTDPVLFERILRNLISNAVRYTETGHIVVGCRRRDKRLSVEIWDTGIGIPADQQDLIFQEFYQIGNPERDRTRGLGLGLAIVRRLTRILDVPLTVQSRVKQGSVFKLSVARADDRSTVIEPLREITAGTQRPLFILVIDDELAIREAITILLTGWGHSVAVAGSCEEMLARAADFTATPDLIMSDYRLHDGENGIETIERLRSEFNDDIPAILITGDTAPDRLRESTAADCFLMHKPVSNAKLRAAIGDLTSAATKPAAALD